MTTSLACAVPIRHQLLVPARIVVPVAFALLAVSTSTSIFFLATTCLLLGLALGVVTRQALGSLPTGIDLLEAVSVALAIGLAVSLVVYLVVPAVRLTTLSILALVSILLLFTGSTTASSATGLAATKLFTGLPFGYFPFFVMMGAYWSFLELYGQTLDAESGLAIWLLLSLLSGAVGSTLAGRLPENLWRWVRVVALIAAALTGAASYAFAAPVFVGLSIIANGFFLFLFFPLYLTSQGARAPQAMALYLVGFAFGGLVGAILIEFGGYTSLSLAILLSPLAVWANPSFGAVS
ncbi:hypothetical protein [uncultured Ruegeria sp.]|uniref:hypothetical protein n=1 Tax=uncultured Ruegeria sp. TaxID=259304 RepID=UPI00261D9306|nr:hypothetical protein [uncultured Ruegeria sp.]